jgi:hypothetical protein
MNIAAYFKQVALVESGDDSEWKLDIRIPKRTLLDDADAQEEMIMLQSGGVRLIMTHESNPDYESPKEKKAREEREKYDAVMAEKRRHEAEARALPLEESHETEAPEPSAISLPPVEIVKIGDYVDEAGNRFLVRRALIPDDETEVVAETWQIQILPVGDDQTFDALDLDTNNTYASVEAAREALKVWAEARGYTPVPPEGFGRVYGDLWEKAIVRKGIVRIAAFDDGSDFPRFRAYHCVGENAELPAWLKYLNSQVAMIASVAAADAQDLLDVWATEADDGSPVPVMGYIDLMKIGAPEKSERVAATIYRDHSAPYATYSIAPAPGGGGTFAIVCKHDGADNRFITLLAEDDHSPERAQAALDALAEKKQWHRVPEMLVQSGPAELPPTEYIHAVFGVIFVNAGLDSDTFGTFRRKPTGSLKRVVSKDMPKVVDRNEAQDNLDRWAAKHKLDVFDVTSDEAGPDPDPDYNPLTEDAAPGETEQMPAYPPAEDISDGVAPVGVPASPVATNPAPKTDPFAPLTTIPLPTSPPPQHLFDDGEQERSHGTRVGPPLMSYVRVGDKVAMLPAVAATVKFALWEAGKPKALLVREVDSDNTWLRADGYGTIFAREANSDWRLVLCPETICIGDRLDNGLMEANVIDTGAIVRLHDAARPDSRALNVSWDDLNLHWSMLARARLPEAAGEPVSVGPDAHDQ